MANATGEFMQRLRMAAVKAVSEDDIRSIFTALVEKAKKGDLNAAKLLFAHVLPPQPAVQALTINAATNRNPQPSAFRQTKALPRTEEKLLVMEQRVENGKPVCHPMDAGSCGEE